LDFCGDHYVDQSDLTAWEDGNSVSGDGWGSDCKVEPGWECNTTIYSEYNHTSYWATVCGDGILTSNEAWDDDNIIDQDGCSSLWTLEPGFNCTSVITNTPPTIWDPICGDGRRVIGEQWDDGNLYNGDGCTNTCTKEIGYSCTGGSFVTADTWKKVWGDEISDLDPATCDDGNTISGDGWDINCLRESGFAWTYNPDGLTVCNEICGDGIRTDNVQWDDGNTIDGDGWSSICTEEPEFTCSGGTLTKKDIWKEKCGDGLSMDFLEWDDGNNVNGDGWDYKCEYENWYEWYGGSSSGSDTCYPLTINATMGLIQSDYSFTIDFDHDMQNSSIGLNDMAISISSDSIIKFSWKAQYKNSTFLLIKLVINSVLQGGEILKIKFTNDKVFRGPNGGCVKPTIFTTNLESSLNSVAASAQAASDLMQYIVLGGTIAAFGLILILGGSLEMVWSLINTLQIISFLPLMISYYPEHVKIMFSILEFSNMDIEFISNFFKKFISIDGLATPSYNSRFFENGIESPLFLSNWASLLFSLLMSLFTLLLWLSLYSILRWEKTKNFFGKIVGSYFFNNFLRFFTEGFLEISFGAFLNVASFNTHEFKEIVSLVIAFLWMGLCIVFPGVAFAMLFDKKAAIKAGNTLYLKRYGTLYKDFKTDREWYTFQYYPLFMVRRLIFVLFLIVFIDYPFVQCNFFIFFSGLVRFQCLTFSCLFIKFLLSLSSTTSSIGCAP
jgi:cysteine-rich repeat protein